MKGEGLFWIVVLEVHSSSEPHWFGCLRPEEGNASTCRGRIPWQARVQRVTRPSSAFITKNSLARACPWWSKDFPLHRPLEHHTWIKSTHLVSSTYNFGD